VLFLGGLDDLINKTGLSGVRFIFHKVGFEKAKHKEEMRKALIACSSRILQIY